MIMLHYVKQVTNSESYKSTQRTPRSSYVQSSCEILVTFCDVWARSFPSLRDIDFVRILGMSHAIYEYYSHAFVVGMANKIKIN